MLLDEGSFLLTGRPRKSTSDVKTAVRMYRVQAVVSMRFQHADSASRLGGMNYVASHVAY